MSVPKGFKQTEVGVIPKDWSLVSLSSICDVRDGTHESPTYQKDGVVFITSKNIFDGKIDFSGSTFISKKDAIDIDKRSKVDKNDILMSMIGTIGNCALIDFDPNFCIKNIALIKPQRISEKFLFQFLTSCIFKKYISAKLDGGIQQFVSLGVLRRLQISIPPIRAEQTAIATALSDMDALIEGVEKLLEKKRRIKQGAMQELLTSRTRLPGYSKRWETKKLGDIVSLCREHIVPSKNPEQVFVHFSLPAFDGGRNPVVEIGTAIKSNKFRVPQYAVLVSKLNPRIPRIWTPEEIPENSIASTEFLVFLPSKTNRKFLHFVCSSPFFCEKMESSATGTTGSHQRMNPKESLDISLYIPSDLSEQTAIAAILSDMDSEIEQLETQLTKYRQLKTGMMQELLTGKKRLV